MFTVLIIIQSPASWGATQLTLIRICICIVSRAHQGAQFFQNVNQTSNKVTDFLDKNSTRCLTLKMWDIQVILGYITNGRSSSRQTVNGNYIPLKMSIRTTRLKQISVKPTWNGHRLKETQLYGIDNPFLARAVRADVKVPATEASCLVLKWKIKYIGFGALIWVVMNIRVLRSTTLLLVSLTLSSEMSAHFQRTTWCNIPEDRTLQN